jgi:hypothetical protein
MSRLLRAFFPDKDLHRVKYQLDQAAELLKETQRILGAFAEFQTNRIKSLLEEDRRIRAEEERTKVDPDFLALLWASVAFALAIGRLRGQTSTEAAFRQRPDCYKFSVVVPITSFSVLRNHQWAICCSTDTAVCTDEIGQWLPYLC